MLFAGIGEGQAEIYKPGGKVSKRDGNFLPRVPITGWFHKGGADVLAIRGDRHRRAIAGGGITEGYFLTAFESKAVIFGPMRMIDCSEEGVAPFFKDKIKTNTVLKSTIFLINLLIN